MIGPRYIVCFTLIPLLAGTLNIALHRWRGAQRIVGAAALVANLALALAALLTVYHGADEAGGVLVSQMGNWPAPYGITIAVDALAAVMLAVTGAVILGVYLYALSQLPDRFEGGYFHSTYLFLLLGVNWAFITGDLFNLFVAFEIMLMSSYVLMAAGTTGVQMRQSYKYVLLNLFSSTLFVTACGLLYGHLGTLNIAEITHLSMSGQIPPRALPAIALLLIVFGSKTAAFPLWYWLPDTYPTMPPPVAGLFAGLLTKVGVYTMIRTFLMMFGADAAVRELVQPIILVSAGGTMFLGVLGAVSSHNVRRILSIHVISQVGYMVLGVGLGTELALAATVLYMVQHMIVKSTLFLCCGLIERYAGTDELERLGGLLKRDGWLATLFLIAALSLAGLPPLSGFFGKLLLLIESLRLRGFAGYTLATLAVVTSLLTLLSMLKIWSFAFWSPAPPRIERHRELPHRRAGLVVIAAMVLLALSVGFGAQQYMNVARVAARGVLDPRPYVSAVLGASVISDPGRGAIVDADVARRGRGRGRGGAAVTHFLLHLTLALLWVLLWGFFDLYTFLAGVVVGFALLVLYGRPQSGAGARFAYPVRQVATLGYPSRLWRLISFAAYFVKILIIANWQVAKLVLSPSMPIHPRIVRYDVTGLTPAQITTLAGAITLTPGTLAADLSSDDRYLYIHCLNAPDAGRALAELDELKERLLKGVFT